VAPRRQSPTGGSCAPNCGCSQCPTAAGSTSLLEGEYRGIPVHVGAAAKRRLSDVPQARVFDIEIPCVQCGIKRRYRRERDRHLKLCRKCSRSGERVERTEFICAGYRDHGAIRHANDCPRTRRLAPYQIRNRELRKKRKPSLVFDASLRMYQSPGCASAGRLLAGIEKRLREHHPGKIRSRKQRSKLLHKYEAAMNPNFNPDVEKIRNQRRQRVALGVTKARLIRWWSRATAGSADIR
jgi:hypothetical protein